MVKKKNEQAEYNKERLVDINLILQYMESLDVTKEYFTELGEGHLRGLGSVKDEIKFISKKGFNIIFEERELYKRAMVELEIENKELQDTITGLKIICKSQKKRLDKKWFKNG